MGMFNVGHHFKNEIISMPGKYEILKGIRSSKKQEFFFQIYFRKNP